MSKLYIKIILLITFLLNVNFLQANNDRGSYQIQSSSQEVYTGDIIPPYMPPQGSGNIGTPGSQATPIDQNIVILITLAILLASIYYFYKNKEKKVL